MLKASALVLIMMGCCLSSRISDCYLTCVKKSQGNSFPACASKCSDSDYLQSGLSPIEEKLYKMNDALETIRVTESILIN